MLASPGRPSLLFRFEGAEMPSQPRARSVPVRRDSPDVVLEWRELPGTSRVRSLRGGSLRTAEQARASSTSKL